MKDKELRQFLNDAGFMSGGLYGGKMLPTRDYRRFVEQVAEMEQRLREVSVKVELASSLLQRHEALIEKLGLVEVKEFPAPGPVHLCLTEEEAAQRCNRQWREAECRVLGFDPRMVKKAKGGRKS